MLWKMDLPCPCKLYVYLFFIYPLLVRQNVTFIFFLINVFFFCHISNKIKLNFKAKKKRKTHHFQSVFIFPTDQKMEMEQQIFLGAVVHILSLPVHYMI